MKSQRKGIGRQRGFTLVEMSVTMVIAGLLFAAVTTGQELVAQAKASKLVGEIKLTEMQLQRYNQAKGRFPGDCNADGIIDYAADANAASASLRGDTDNASRAAEYSYSVLLPTDPGDGQSADLESDGCAIDGLAALTGVADVDPSPTNANVWINDLKLAGVVSDSASNRKLAKLVHEDFMFVGKITDNGAVSADGADYNAIVIHNVPQWMARRLSTAINGQDARADRSRLRVLARAGSDGTYSATWDVSGAVSGATPEMRDSMVTVAYFFDAVPESQAGGAAAE